MNTIAEEIAAGTKGLALLLGGAACVAQGITDAKVALDGSVRFAVPDDLKEKEVVPFVHEEEAAKGLQKLGKGLGAAAGMGKGALGMGKGALGKGAKGLSKGFGAGKGALGKVNPLGRKKKKAAAAAAAAVRLKGASKPEPEAAPEAAPEPGVVEAAPAVVVAEAKPESTSAATPAADPDGVEAAPSSTPEGMIEIMVTLPQDVEPGRKLDVACGWLVHTMKIGGDAPLLAGAQMLLHVPDSPEPGKTTSTSSPPVVAA